jgi:multiple antibiotic resistance protein
MIIETLKLVVPVFIITSPLGAVPLFLGMTQEDSPARRRRTAVLAAVTATLALIGAALAGQAVFDFFGVSIDAFRIAGGILLFIIALDFVQLRQARMKTTDSEIADGQHKTEVGIIPLGTPMLTGPAAMATAMVLSNSRGDGSLAAAAPLYLAFLLNGVIILVVLMASMWLQRFLTASAMGIILRLEGLLLAAIGVQMSVTGVTNLVISTAAAIRP